MSELPNKFHEALASNLAEKLSEQTHDMMTFGQSTTFIDRNFIEELAKLTPEQHREIVNEALKKMGEPR